jgi:hypothetical protein
MSIVNVECTAIFHACGGWKGEKPSKVSTAVLIMPATKVATCVCVGGGGLCEGCWQGGCTGVRRGCRMR